MSDHLADFARRLETSLAAPWDATRWLSVTHDPAGLAEAERAAAERGLEIGEVVPFGVLLGGSALLAPLEQTHRWTRLMSWLDADQRLGAAALHLDRILALGEPSWATRALVSLDRSADPLPRPARTDLETALRSAKARYLCFSVLEATRAGGDVVIDPTDVLVPERHTEYVAWRRAQQLDCEATALMRAWSAGTEDRFRRKTDVTLACDYELVRDVLALTHGGEARL